MRKIKDRLMLAAAASLVGAMPSRISARYLAGRNLIDFDFDELGAGMFLKGHSTQTTAGKVTGFVVNESNNLVAAALLTYLLSATGRDNAVLKGMGVGLSMWVFINGLLSGSILRKKSTQPWTPLINLALHVVSGALAGLVISAVGDDALFPDMKAIGKGEKLPVLSMWQTVDLE